MQFLAALSRRIDIINERIGRTVAWIALIMVLVQVVIVLMRYVFGVGSIMMQESVVYMHAMLFMAAAGYALVHDGHVRIDIVYREASPRTKAIIDLAGSVLFLLPLCVLIVWVSWRYVSVSWAVLEGSKETSGIQGVFLLKTLIPLFAGLLGLQGLSLAIRSGLTLAGRNATDVGHRNSVT
ncbi:MAG: TRAP transporter small permease subunit [Rhodospirillales bacterium]|nr:TRAP transporter small permease subunit [Rhodospirillales bacterium]